MSCQRVGHLGALGLSSAAHVRALLEPEADLTRLDRAAGSSIAPLKPA